jgi:hypothetical protein
MEQPIGIYTRPRKVALAAQRLNRGLFVVFCATAALDYRSDKDSSSVIQMVLASVACVTFGCFILNVRSQTRDLSTLRRVTWLWWIYLAASPLLALLRGVPATHYLRTVLPDVLMGEGLIIGYFLLGDGEKNAILLFKGIYYTSIVSTIVFLFKGLSEGLPVDEIRYQIVSPLLMILISFAIFRLFFEGSKSGLLNVTGLMGGLTILFLSVTRTYALSFCATLASIGYISFRPPRWMKRRLHRRIIGNQLLIIGTLGMVAILAILAFPTILRSWSARSSIIGSRDPTMLTRIAEAAGEIEATTGDTSHLLFGSGIGSDHRLDERYLIGVAAATTELSAGYIYTPGHIAWVYEFYASGLLMGWVLPFILLVSIWRGNSRERPYVARIASTGLLTVFVTSTLSNVLFFRGGGVGLGLLIALSLFGSNKTYRTQRKRRTSINRIFRTPLEPAFGSGDGSRLNEGSGF